MLCTECPKYSNCEALCADAEEFVGQDHVSYGKGRVFVQNRPLSGSAANEWIDIISKTEGTEMPEACVDMADIDKIQHIEMTMAQYRAIVAYFIGGKSMSWIGEQEGVSRQAIRKRIMLVATAAMVVRDRLDEWSDIVNNLGDMSDQQQRIAFLYFFELMNQREIAKLLDSSYQYVSQVIFKIREYSKVD